MANRDIAIIGIAGRFPDADNINQLYTNLCAGKDSLKPISAERLINTTLDPSAEYRVCGYLEDIDKFDHKFFKISMAEAQTMDPHQRILLETVYHLFESAAYNPDSFQGSRTSLYVADSILNYYEHADEFVPTLKTGNVKAFIGARIASFFKLTGNVTMIDTSCSSALAAVHYACNDIALGDADYAIACGVNLDLFPLRKGEPGLDLDSPDGKSRPFSAQANGMSFGEAAGAVLLKSLEKAQQDNDIIYAIIKGSAINNNAGRSASLTAPDNVAQAEVITRAWHIAGIDPRTIQFIEAHGSGTQLGDTIEIAGINAAFHEYTFDRKFCAVSTSKSNLGHSRGAAGIVGLIRCVLALNRKVLFPAIYFDEPSPFIDFENSAVFVNDKLLPWESPQHHKRHAGITSIGLSGTNCHVVLEEGPEIKPGIPSIEDIIVIVSAATRHALMANLQALYDHIHSNSEVSLHDIAYTLATGRQHMLHRFAVVVNSISELMIVLQAEILASHEASESGNQPIILLTDHTADVGNDLINYLCRNFHYFKASFSECFSIRETYKEHNTTEQLDFLFQYAFYKWLSHIGCNTERVLALGKGQILLELLKGDVTLEQALEKLSVYIPVPLLNIEKRIDQLLEKEGDRIPLFIDPGVRSEISERLKNRQTNVSDFSNNSTRDLLSLVAKLYTVGATIHWHEFYKECKFNRVPLSLYQFDKIHCWLREMPRASVSAANIPTNSFEQMSSTERAIALIWAKVLQTVDITNNCSFFEMGGDSLLATKVINGINQTLQTRLDFEDIFDFQTVRALANHIESIWTTEQKIIFLWKTILKVDKVDRSDNFFELGGHSLIANQIINGISEVFNVSLNFDIFFEYPTVGQLAIYLDTVATQKQLFKPFEISLAERKNTYVVSHAQKRLWIVSQWDEGSVAYNQSESYWLDGILNKDALLKAFEHLIRRHESLRTVFVTTQNGVEQKILDYEEVVFRIEVINIESESGYPIKDIIDTFAREKFDLEKGPLIRIKLLKIADQSHVLLFNTHHIISDGWSGGVISREIFQLYKAFLGGHVNPLLPLRIQYKDYAEWLNDYLDSDRLITLKKFWVEMFSDGVPILNIPTDLPRPSIRSYHGDRHTIFVSPELTAEIKKSGLQSNTTLFMNLLAGLNILLYHFTKQSDIVVGTASAGRDHPDLANQVGFYVNTLPIRSVFNPNQSSRQIRELIKSVMLEAFRHQHYPFDLLINDLTIDRDLSRSPLFDVWFVFQNTEVEDNDVSMGDLHITEYADDSFYSRYDLMFDAREYDNGIRIQINFSTDLFHKETIVKLGEDMLNVLALMVNNVDQAVGQMDIYSHQYPKSINSNNWNVAQTFGPSIVIHESDKERNARRLVAKARTLK